MPIRGLLESRERLSHFISLTSCKEFDMGTVVFPPEVITGRRFPNVFVFPRKRIVDPGNNVLLIAKLFNFKIDSDQPLRDHDLFLGIVAAPLMTARRGAGARIIGLASRSGKDLHNLLLSRRRAKNVDVSLSFFLFASDLVNPPSPPARTSTGGQGEHAAEIIGQKDGTEDPQFRAVLLTILVDRTKNTPVRVLPK